MNATVPQAMRRSNSHADAPIDRALSLAIVVAFVLLVVALVGTVTSAISHARDDDATFAAFSTAAKAGALARAMVADRTNGKAPGGRSTEALAAVLDDPALHAASQATIAAARARASDLGRSVAGRRGRDATTVARDLAAFGSVLEDVRTEIATASIERARARSRDVVVGALAIVVAFAIVTIGGSVRLRRTRAVADRFSAMLERMLADVTRSTIDLREAKRTEVVRKKARGRFVMNVDFRYVVTKPFSEELGEIFEIGDLEGYPFGTLLRRIAPTHDRAALAAFAERLFDPTYPDAMLASHRLHEVRTGARTLAFAFERIWDRDEIESIVVAVSDITPIEPTATEIVPDDDLAVRQAAYAAFVAATSQPQLDALVSELATYGAVLGRTLGSKDMVRQLGTLHEATTLLSKRLVALHFTYLAEKVEHFDTRTVDRLRRPGGAERDDLSYAFAIADLTSELEALRATIPRAPSPRNPPIVG